MRSVLNFSLVASLISGAAHATHCTDKAKVWIQLATSRAATWATGTQLRLEGSRQRLTLGGQVLTHYERPETHHWGVSNVGLYALPANGRSHLLKLISDGNDGNSEARHIGTLQGVLIGAALGGAKIYRYGRLRLLNGRQALYVEMEWMFAGLPSVSWKGLRRMRTPPRYALLADGVPSPIQQIARLFVAAYEHGVRPGPDLDFIISGGQVRWLDTADWTFHSTFDASLLRSLNTLFTQLHSIQPSYAAQFRVAFLENLRTSDEFDDEAKQRIASLVVADP